jgi:transcriptional regulator with XRE-family HTH domain
MEREQGERGIERRIAAERARQRLSQVDLANRIGIAKAQLSRYEVGSTVPRPVMVRKIADALGMRYDTLLGSEPDAVDPVPVRRASLLAENVQHLMDRHGLNPNSLAARLGQRPPQATIFRILSGESETPRDATLEPLARHFGVTVQQLRYERLASLSGAPAPLSPQVQELAELVTQLLERGLMTAPELDALVSQLWIRAGAQASAKTGEMPAENPSAPPAP